MQINREEWLSVNEKNLTWNRTSSCIDLQSLCVHGVGCMLKCGFCNVFFILLVKSLKMAVQHGLFCSFRDYFLDPINLDVVCLGGAVLLNFSVYVCVCVRVCKMSFKGNSEVNGIDATHTCTKILWDTHTHIHAKKQKAWWRQESSHGQGLQKGQDSQWSMLHKQ